MTNRASCTHYERSVYLALAILPVSATRGSCGSAAASPPPFSERRAGAFRANALGRYLRVLPAARVPCSRSRAAAPGLVDAVLIAMLIELSGASDDALLAAALLWRVFYWVITLPAG